MNTLEQTLERMLDLASETPGKPVATRLRGGLHIRMTARNGILNLELRRDRLYPSDTEWITVLNHMPFACSYHLPERRENWVMAALIGIEPKLEGCKREQYTTPL